MNSIKKCVAQQTLKFDTAAVRYSLSGNSQIISNKDNQTKKLLPYIQDGALHYSFLGQMSAFIQLLSSGANAILTLEGQNTTCADVFYVWVCIAFHLEQVLASPSVGIMHQRGRVIEIYNHRFNQMMSESSHNIFLLAYFLHPCEFLDHSMTARALKIL